MRLIALSLSTAALVALAPAQAAVLPTDGSWASFTVDAILPPYSYAWVDDNYAPLNFDFSIPAGFYGTLTVVDAGYSGDRFTVWNGGVALGETSPAVNNVFNGPGLVDFSAALANPDFSRGVFTLGAGNYSISGLMSLSASDAFGNLDATIGGIRVEVSPVPEPATLASLLAGMGLIGLVLRRRVHNV